MKSDDEGEDGKDDATWKWCSLVGDDFDDEELHDEEEESGPGDVASSGRW